MAVTYDLNIQTVFTPPPACTTAGVTRMAISSFELWNNAIVPAAKITETSCYPSQFWSSALATSSLPPFEQLICPESWGSYDVNSTYIICCPKGFGLYAPNLHNGTRPAESAYCTSRIYSNMWYELTSYDSAGVKTTLDATETGHGTYVLATPFDGIAASTTRAVSIPSSTPSRQTTSSQTETTTTTSMTSSSVSSITPSTSSGIALQTLPPRWF